MLDKKTEAVLKLLIYTVGESYKVINKSQLLAQLPAKVRPDVRGLQNILTFLKENEFIDVKYQDKDEICLSATVKASNYNEKENNIIERANISALQVTLLLVGVFLAAFAGSLLAVFIGRLL